MFNNEGDAFEVLQGNLCDIVGRRIFHCCVQCEAIYLVCMSTILTPCSLDCGVQQYCTYSYHGELVASARAFLRAR